eukprot:scaffold121299_cov28-Tisochrysis_lutea.AAC.2
MSASPSCPPLPKPLFFPPPSIEVVQPVIPSVHTHTAEPRSPFQLLPHYPRTPRTISRFVIEVSHWHYPQNQPPPPPHITTVAIREYLRGFRDGLLMNGEWGLNVLMSSRWVAELGGGGSGQGLGGGFRARAR